MEITNDEQDFEELYQSMVLTHSKKPKNYGKIENQPAFHGKNPNCGDEIHIYLDIQNNIITNIKFEGTGCALSMSCASLLTEKIKKLSVPEAKEIIISFLESLQNSKPFSSLLEPLHIYKNIHKFPLRMRCVTLAPKTIFHIINNNE